MSIKQTSRKTLRRVSVALAVMIGSLSLAGTSQAQAAVYEFQPVSLHVKDVEDWGWGAWDEPRMYYNGAKVWADSVYNTEYVEGHRLPTTRFSTGSSLRIDLLEADDETSYHLGRQTIHPGSTDTRSVTYGGGWAGFEYELSYKVVFISY